MICLQKKSITFIYALNCKKESDATENYKMCLTTEPSTFDETLIVEMNLYQNIAENTKNQNFLSRENN